MARRCWTSCRWALHWLLLWPAVLFPVHLAAHGKPMPSRLRGLPGWVFALGLGVAAGVAVTFAALDAQPFVYFQF